MDECKDFMAPRKSDCASGQTTHIEGPKLRVRSFGKNTKAQRQYPQHPEIPVKQHKLLFNPEKHLDFDQGAIFQVTQQHLKYTFNGTTLEHLDKYTDATIYGIFEKNEQERLNDEIRDLIEAARIDGHYLLDGQESLRSTVDDAFDGLANVADQLRCNISIIRLDNDRIALAHCKNDISETVESFMFQRRYLASRFNHNHSKVTGSAPKLIEPPERNKQLYFTLVDYITATVARYLTQTATAAFWYKQIFAILAAIRVKLKVLCYEPARFANLSIENANQAIEEMKQLNDSKESETVSILITDSKKSNVHMAVTDTITSRRYHQEKSMITRFIWELLNKCVMELLVNEMQPSSAGCFETHAALYKTSIDGLLTKLNHERAGDVSASQELMNIRYTQHAFNLVFKNLKGIRALNAMDQYNTAPDLSIATMVDCGYQDKISGDIYKTPVCTTNLGHVISILVPLCLSGFHVGKYLTHLMTFTSSCTNWDDPILQFDPNAFYRTAYFTISTAKWLEKQNQFIISDHKDRDIRSFPRTPWHQRLLGDKYSPPGKATTPGSESVTAAEDEYDAKFLDEMERLEVQYNRSMPRMSSQRWTVGRDTITVDCHRYVTVLVIVAIIIVCGGVAIPFTVGERIWGVDPFQLTTFTWVFAGFIILFSKSRYVTEWPWHDFVHRRVVCRSVRDLCEVTGVGAQVILMHLLRQEYDTVLTTKGPHNSMFRTISDAGEGFEIDEPTHITTLFLSGYIPLKVYNVLGEHLVCLDTRRSTHCINCDKFMGCLAYRDIGDFNDPAIIKKLSHQDVKIYRIIGVYVGDSYFGGTWEDSTKKDEADT